MAWRYRCGTCQETTGWMPRADAERARTDHRARAHGGLTPDGESLTSNAERLDPRLLLIVFGACLALWALNWLAQHL